MRRWCAQAVLLLAAACGGGGPEGETLRVDVVADGTSSYALSLATAATQATLIAHDGSGATVPGIASSWRFLDDGRSLILRLKPVKWSDDRPLDAAQIVASIKRAKAAGGSPALAALDSVSAPTSRVVELRLTAPVPGLLDWLAQPELAITRPVKGAPTLGSYRIEDAAARPLVIARLADEASPEARPARIAVNATDTPAKAIRRFMAGETDVVIGEGLNGFGAAQAAAPARALRVEALWGSYGWLANPKSGPLADARLRRALAMAIDRNAVVRRMGSALTPQSGIVPAALAGGAPVLPDWAGTDPVARQAEAVQVLAAAGFTAASPLRLTLLLPPGDDHLAAADAVKADWAPMGVLVAVTILPQEALLRAVARGDYDLALMQQAVPVADRGALLAPFACAARIYCSAPVDAQLAAARIADPAARAGALAKAEAAILDDTPYIALFTPVRWALVRPDVSGWTPNPAGSHPLTLLLQGAKAR